MPTCPNSGTMAGSGCGMVWYGTMHMQFARLMLCSTVSFTLSTMCVLCVYSTHKAIKRLGCGHEVLPDQVMKYFERHNIIIIYLLQPALLLVAMSEKPKIF